MGDAVIYEAPDFTAQGGSTVKNNIEKGFQAGDRIWQPFLPHEQPTPDLTVAVDAGWLWEEQNLQEIAAQDSPSFTAPSNDDKIDRLVIDPSDGSLEIVQGSEAASPSPPSIPAGRLPICQVALSPNESQIDNSDITDERVSLWGQYVAEISGPVLQTNDLAANGGSVPEINRSNDFGANDQTFSKSIIADNNINGTGVNVLIKTTTRTKYDNVFAVDRDGSIELGIKADGALVVGSGASNFGAGRTAVEQTLLVGSTVSESFSREGVVFLSRDSNSSGVSVGEVSFQWNGNEVARILCSSGDDTSNKDDGDLKFISKQGGSTTGEFVLHQEGGVTIGNATQQGAGTLAVEKQLVVDTSAGTGYFEAFGSSSVKVRGDAVLGLESSSGSQIQVLPGGSTLFRFDSDGGFFTENATGGSQGADTINAGDYFVHGGAVAPIGLIAMWYGSTANIPSGWALCDGSTYTDREGNSLTAPDLRDRFVVGAGSSYSVDDTGGADSVALTTSELPAHSHSVSVDVHDSSTSLDANTVGNGDSGNPQGAQSQSSGDTGNGDAHENRPPYYALAYIIKL